MKKSFKPSHQLTVSTALTIARIGLIAPITWAILTQQWMRAAIFFALAAISDILDGKIARWRNERTTLGAVLDPIADKLLLSSCFLSLSAVASHFTIIPTWFIALVIIKESLIGIGTLLLAIFRGYVPIAPTNIGKASTVAQSLLIFGLIIGHFTHQQTTDVTTLLLGISTVLIVISCIQYIRIGIGQLLARQFS